MPVFDYTALNHLGRQERGTVDAESLAAARRQLRAAGVHVVRLAEGGSETVARREETVRRIRPTDLAAGIRQLATLLNAGMPLVPALGALVEQLDGHPLGQVIVSVRDRVNAGAPLATALSEHPRVFSDLFVNMVRAGETAGVLEAILLRMADMLQRRVSLTSKVKAALVYPAVLAAVGVGVIVFLLTFVVPSISKLFLEMNRALPWPTRFLISASDYIREYFWAGAVVIAIAVLAFRSWIATPGGRLAWDGLKLRMPFFGDLFLKVAVARFARTFGVLLASGVAILDAFAIVKRLVGNRVIGEALEKAGASVGKGDSIAEPLRRSGVFPPLVYHMIAVGERSGNVEDRLLEVAATYEEEVEAKTVALTSILEPVMILVMGVVVGFIVLSILLPIFEINEVIR